MATLPRILAIMGSGETAPTMVSTHQALLARLPLSAAAVLVETPYGFQENADEISERTATYFAHNVGHRIDVVGLRSDIDVEHASDIARLQTADYVFAGPGSPTYALDRWRGSPFADVVTEKLRRGGIVVFASAAAVSLGSHAVPVYEVYKVGQSPHWVDGLDLMAVAGIAAAVIPHFDNAEGGTHDTRFCYLGERRLQQMEQALGSDTCVIGVDEHTALILDLDARTATVRGRGRVTVRRGGRQLRILDSGSSVAIGALTSTDDGAPSDPAQPAVPDAPGIRAPVPAARTLGEIARDATLAFDAAVERRDGAGAAEAILQLEAAIAAWSADTTQTDEGDRARGTLRGLVVRLGDVAADGLADPAERLAPMIDGVVSAREELRSQGDYGLADRLRASADAAGIELRDTPEGTTWRLVSG